MAKSEDELFDSMDDEFDSSIEKDQLSDSDLKFNRKMRQQVDDLLEKKALGAEDSDEEYLDHYYDFDDD